MKNKYEMKLPSRIAAMLTSFAVVFAMVLVIGVSATKAYAAEGDLVAQGNYNGMDWKLVEKSDGTNELQLGKEGPTQILDREAAAAESIENGFTINPDTGKPERVDITAQSYQEAYDGAIANIKQFPWTAEDDLAQSVTSVKIVGNIKAKGSLDNFFAGLTNCERITGLGKIDTSDVTLMRQLFGYMLPVESPNNPGDVGYWIAVPNRLQSVVVPYWNLKKLISLEAIFAGCTELTDVSLGFDTRPVSPSEGGNLSTIGGLFDGCKKLENISIGENFDVSSVQFAHNLFRECTSLKSVDVSWLENCKAKEMYGMFNKCRELETIENLDKLNTANAQNLGNMFRECHKLSSIDLSNFDTSNVTNMQSMFYEVGMKNPDFQEIDVSSFDTSKVTSMNSMFAGNTNTTKIIGLERFDTSNVEDMFNMFMKCEKIDDIAMLCLDMSKVNDARGMLTRCNAIVAKLDEMSKSDQYSPEAKAKLADAKTKLEALTPFDTTTDQVKSTFAIVASELKDAAKEDVQRSLENANRQEVADAANNASAATKEAYDKAKAELENVLADPNSTATDINAAIKALDDAVAGLTPKSDAEKVADEAKKAYEDAKKKADEEAAKNPGSDVAVKAAEDATAKAKDFQKAAEDAVKAAEATGNQADIDAAKAMKAESDKAKVEAAKLEAEQKQIKADNLLASNPNSQEAIAAGQAAVDAANAYKKDAEAVYGAGSAEANAAQQQVNKATETNNKITEANDVKPGDQFVFNNQKYEVLTVAANGNGTAALVKGKNAKSVTVPKTASYTEKGKTFDVTEINTKAFYKKTKKVTVGANVDTIDKQAFKGSKVATVVLKTKDLTKKSVKGALKGSKVKTVQVKVGSKKVNKKFVKKYKKIFTKKNAGKKVTVK